MSKAGSSHNVLILINVRWWNATAFYAVNIARLLHKNGHRVFVGCNPDYPAYAMAKRYGIPVVPMNFYGFNPVALIGGFLRMVRLIRDEKITIVNSHRSEDHTFALLAKYLTGAKCVITRGDQRRIAGGALSAWRYRLCDAVIATCRSILEQNRHIFDPIQHKTAVIYGSVDEDHFRTTRPRNETLEKYGMDNGMRIIGLVGRLSWVKDPFTVVKAARRVLDRHPDALFLITGKAVDIRAADLQKAVGRSAMADRFVFIPQIDDIADLMGTLDIALITSVASETISRVLLEYMYLGKPVVATTVNAIGEIVSPESTGFLIDPKDHRALAEKIIALLDDDEMRKSYGDNAARRYRSAYSEEGFYTEYLKVFDRIACPPRTLP